MLKRAIFVEYILTYSMNMNDGFNLASGNWNDKIEPIQKELEVQITCDTVLWMENLLVFLDRKDQIWSTVETLESKGSKTRNPATICEFIVNQFFFSLSSPIRKHLKAWAAPWPLRRCAQHLDRNNFGGVHSDCNFAD